MEMVMATGIKPKPKNVLGTDLKCCCLQPLTGWFRDGNCRTNAEDRGNTHGLRGGYERIFALFAIARKRFDNACAAIRFSGFGRGR